MLGAGLHKCAGVETVIKQSLGSKLRLLMIADDSNERDATYLLLHTGFFWLGKQDRHDVSDQMKYLFFGHSPMYNFIMELNRPSSPLSVFFCQMLIFWDWREILSNFYLEIECVCAKNFLVHTFGSVSSLRFYVKKVSRKNVLPISDDLKSRVNSRRPHLFCYKSTALPHGGCFLSEFTGNDFQIETPWIGNSSSNLTD